MTELPQRLGEDIGTALRTMPDLYLLRDWLTRMINDPSERQLVLDVAWPRGLVLGAALLLDRFTSFALRRPAARLRASAPDPAEAMAAGDGTWHRVRRLPVAAGGLVLELVPVAIFWTAATLLAGLVPVPLTRLAIGIVVNAYIAPE